MRFDPEVGMQRIPPANIRPFASGDLSACRELYELNEPGRFPPGLVNLFTNALTSPLYLFLVVEAQGKLAAVGGICRVPESATACSLVFGMVHPDLHRHRLGTALLLARLAALDRPPNVWWAHLSSAGGSSTFYERFGFRHFGRYPLPPTMIEFDCYRCYVEESDWKRCAEILAGRGVRLDLAGARVPVGPAVSRLAQLNRQANS